MLSGSIAFPSEGYDTIPFNILFAASGVAVIVRLFPLWKVLTPDRLNSKSSKFLKTLFVSVLVAVHEVPSHVSSISFDVLYGYATAKLGMVLCWLIFSQI